MERWLWFLLIAAVGAFCYDYGRKSEQLPQAKATTERLAAALDVYAERDRLREQLASERAARDRAIADAMARVAVAHITDRAEAAAAGLDACVIDPELDRVRRERDVQANREIRAANESARSAPAD